MCATADRLHNSLQIQLLPFPVVAPRQPKDSREARYMQGEAAV
jgi:hypothetical protein